MNISKDDLCPCGSELKYGKCCKYGWCSDGYTPGEIDNLRLNKWISYRGKVGREREAFCKAYINNKQLVLSAISVRQTEAARAAGEKITCHRGCSYCCSQFFATFIEEVEAVVYYLYQNKKALISFLSAYKSWEAKINKHKPLVTDLTLASNATTSDRGSEDKRDHFMSLVKQYLELDIPCPFLNDNTCSIYDVRPWACASLAVCTQAEWCSARSTEKPKTFLGYDWEGFANVPFYRKIEHITTTLPKAAFNTLLAGTYYLAKFPGLETLNEEAMEDHEVKLFVSALRR
ncbi:MAG: SEC-C domain-containing protein [Chloroflexi bacterium]|nr:SEC-C domain-containing protein [Chloroflexota bacterium]